ncbi:UNVERIFIED_ORG: hypothetical protein ABIB52_002541 [Arthrobacter sp. UYCu721]
MPRVLENKSFSRQFVCPENLVADPAGTGIRRVRLSRTGGDIELFRPGLTIAELTQPGQPAQRISLPRRSLKHCLAEELRRLDPDTFFGDVLKPSYTHEQQKCLAFEPLLPPATASPLPCTTGPWENRRCARRTR